MNCAYGTEEDKMLRDQLIEKAYSATVREKLLLEQPASLGETVISACQIEQAMQNVFRDAALVHAVGSKVDLEGQAYI